MNSKYISKVALFYLLAAAGLALCFELWRALLLLQLRHVAASVPVSTLLESFVVGWRFDFAIAGYIFLPLAILGLLPFIDISRVRALRWFNLGLLFVLVAVAFIANMVDIEYFRAFNTRLNGGALQWDNTPGMVGSMIWEMFPVVRYFLLYFVMIAVFAFVIRFLLKKLVLSRPRSPVLTNLIYLPLLVGILALGARGRVAEKTPLTWGVAYFSEYDFANQLALNPNFTFMRDAVYDASRRDKVGRLMEQIHNPRSENIVYNLLGWSDTTDIGQRMYHHVTFQPESPDRPNVILIIMESFGTTRIGALDSRFTYDLSPNFDSLSHLGTLFTDFYSSGYHTFAGIFSTLYGSPITLGINLLKNMSGQSHYWGLPNILRDHGYYTLFFCPHDPHFDNMQGFLMSNGMMRVYSVYDYGGAKEINTWGVPDHVMYDYALKTLKKDAPRPFFATLLGVTHHGPWTVPDVPFGALPATVKGYEELNAFKYCDWALGRFVNGVLQDTTLHNTFILITSDNGYLDSPQIDLDLTLFHEPFLIINADPSKQQGRRIGELGGQLDVVATLMGMLRMNYDDYSFGHDLLDSNRIGTDYAHFSEWYNIGYIEGDYYVVVRTQGKTSLYRKDDLSRNIADAFPDLTKEYSKKALAIYETAYLNMTRPLPPLIPTAPETEGNRLSGVARESTDALK